MYKLQSYQIELHFRFLDSGGANIWTKSMVTINVLNVQIFAPSARRGEYLDKEHVYVNHALCPRIHPYGIKRTVWYSVRRGQYLYIEYIDYMYKHSPLLHECAGRAKMWTMSTVSLATLARL